MTGTSNMPFPSQQNGNNSEQETAGGMISTIIRIRTIVLVALGVSLLLQTAAVSTPGLYIVSSPTYRHQEGFFFYVFCDKTDEKGTCKTESYSDNYFDAMERASKTDKIILQKRYAKIVVHPEVNAMAAWFFTLVSFIVIILLKKCGQQELKSLILSILNSAMVVSVVIMGEEIYVYLVRLDSSVRLYEVLKEEEGSVGFPYSLFMYILAWIAALVSVVALFKSFFDDIASLIIPDSDQTSNRNDVINEEHCSDSRELIH